MSEIDEIVQVTITANTIAVSQQGFGVMLILGVHNAFPERIRYYRNLAGVAVDFTPDQEEYQAAVLAFSQDIKPEQIAIGRVLSSNENIVTIDQALNNYNYRMVINGQEVLYQSGQGATLANVGTGIVNLINALRTPGSNPEQFVQATSDGAGNITIQPFGTYGDYGFRLGTNLTSQQAIASETFVQALNEIQSISDDWYALVALNRQTTTQNIVFNTDFVAGSTVTPVVNGTNGNTITFTTDQATTMGLLLAELQLSDDVFANARITGPRTIQVTGFNGEPYTLSFTMGGTTPPTVNVASTNTSLSIAQWIEAQKKIYFTATSDPVARTDPTTDTTSLLALFLANGYQRSEAFAYSFADTVYIEAALLGRLLPTTPGSANWAYKTLRGVPVDSYTDTESDNILAKRGMIYQRIGGVNVTREGIFPSGLWIDIRVGIDWLEARIQERVYQLLVSVDKVPYTDEGITMIESALRAQLDEAVSNALIQPDYLIQVPKAADANPLDKAARLLRNVYFTATLTNAINKVIIEGNVGF